MSPRRRYEPGDGPVFRAVRPWRRGLPLVTMLAASVAAAALTGCALVLNSHETQRRTTIRDAAVLDYVRSFMAEFTSPDPFHANDYMDRILAQATADFAERYRQNQNEILIQVARTEPTIGTVLDAGISRWNDDGGADVLVITKLASKSPDGKLDFERTNRWTVTAKQEGERWKISAVIPMI